MAANDVLDSGPPVPNVASIDQPRRRRPAPTEIWHPWASRMWPSTTTEEQIFVTQLHRLNDGTPDRYERRDVTALVTALRSGLTTDELFERASSLRPARLLAAHIDLEVRRTDAENAWRAIVDDPTPSTIDCFGARAAALVPVVISHLSSAMLRHPRALARVVAEADAQIARTTHSVAVLEEQLDLCMLPSDRRVEIGALLYDRRGEGAWALGTFLASRVGQLVPLRVAALLDEVRPPCLRE